MKNNVTRTDGTISSNRAKITNISVSENYTTSNENGYKVIKIGSSSQTITGRHSYTIKYTYNLGKDPLKNADELYYNLIGNEWDASISNVTFKITMPKSFNKQLLGFSSGTKGSTNSSNVSYRVDGNVISGFLINTLSAEEGLTVRLTLPEGYFVGASTNIDMYSIAVIIFSLACVLIADRLWAKYGKDNEVIETVEFYPPEGYNSLEVGLLYKGKAGNKDITSLLIYLANKGYIEIIDQRNDFNFEKVSLSKDSKNNTNEKIIELKSKIKEERKINPNSQKIKYYKNMLDIYENIDTPIDYEQYGLKSSINKINKKNKFLIRKLKDYDGNNINEKWFMEGLFEYGRTEVTDKMLYNKFYITNNRILDNINNKQNKNKIFESTASGKIIWLVLMIIVIFALITIKPVIEYSKAEMLIFALLFSGMGFSYMFAEVLGIGTGTLYVNGKPTESSKVEIVFLLRSHYHRCDPIRFYAKSPFIKQQ